MTGWSRASAGAALLAAMTGDAAMAAGDDPLADHLWRSRILVISARESDDAQLRAQRKALASARRGSAERDLIVLEAVGPGRQATALRQRLGLSGDGFHAVLIGKDGGQKLSSGEPVPPQTLFATIDAMPMRRDEMKRR